MKKKRYNSFSVNIWPVYTDVMSSMLLIVIFVLTIFFVTEFTLAHFLSNKDVMIVKLTSQVKSLMDSLGIIKNKNISLNSKISEKNSMINRLNIKIANNNKNIKNKKLEIKASKEAINKLNEKLEKYLAHINAIDKKLVDKDAEIKNLNNDINNMEKAKNIIAKSLNTQKNIITKLNNDISKKLKKIKNSNEQILALQQTLEQLKKDINELKNTITNKNNKLKQIMSENEIQFKNKDKNILELMSVIKQKQTEIDELKKLTNYRSDFFGKLIKVFANNKDIKIVGDRFIFQSEILFDQASAEVKENGKTALKRFIKTYEQTKKNIPNDVNLIIQVEGHTDNDPIKTPQFPSNWELSTGRSINVVKYFISQGLPSSLFSAAGYAENYPVNNADTPEAKRQNRRIEIKLTTR